MKQILINVIVAAVVSGLVVQAYRVFGGADGADEMADAGSAAGGTADAPPGLSLSYTEALAEDVWVNGARTTGDDHRSLTDAASSVCFITKIEIKGVQGPEDSNSCVMQIDDFTGFWDLVATVDEGGQSEVRCNARCLVWE